jgi:hypothetical protein
MAVELGNTEWHLDKRWHITQIIAMIVMAISAVAYVVERDGHYDKRLSMLESSASFSGAFQHDRDAAQDRDMMAAVELVRRQLDRIEIKLDRAADRDFQLNGKGKP